MLCLYRGWTSADIAQISAYNLSHSLFLFIFNGHRDWFASEKFGLQLAWVWASVECSYWKLWP